MCEKFQRRGPLRDTLEYDGYHVVVGSEDGESERLNRKCCTGDWRWHRNVSTTISAYRLSVSRSYNRGLMIAKALPSKGATVYITGRRLEVLEKAVTENKVEQGLIIP